MEKEMKIVTDSGADISFSKEILENLDIVTVPLKVSLNNKIYYEGVDIQTGDYPQLHHHQLEILLKYIEKYQKPIRIFYQYIFHQV
jgi:fatty acid-binding protein DegV